MWLGQVLLCVAYFIVRSHLRAQNGSEYAMMASTRLMSTYENVLSAGVLHCCLFCEKDAKCGSVSFATASKECYLSLATFDNVHLYKHMQDQWMTFIKPGLCAFVLLNTLIK